MRAKRGWAMRTMLALVALPAVAPCFAADTRPLRIPESAPPTFTVYTPRDGLSDEIWSTVGFDRHGFVWAGSASGLARFDGYRWTPFALDDARSLVRDMFTDDRGVLWAIFEREGLARYDGQRWRLEGMPNYYQRFSRVADGPRHLDYLGHNDGFSRRIGDRWVADPGNAQGGKDRAIAFARTRRLFGEEREWMATAGAGLWFRPTGSQPVAPWQPFTHPDTERLALVHLHVSEDAGREELWVMSYGGGIVRLRDDDIVRFRAGDGALPSEALYGMVETRDAAGTRSLWVATRAGLLRIRSGAFEVFDRRHGLPSDAVRTVKVQQAPDGTPLLWLATEGGMVRAALHDTPWRTVTQLGARENGIFGVLVEPDGWGGERLWVGSASDGLAMLHKGEWQRFTFEAGQLPARAVRGIWRLPGPDGRPHRILGLVGGPLGEIDDTFAFVARDAPWPLLADQTINHAVARSLGGAVEWWFGTQLSGVHRLRAEQWESWELDPAGRPWRVHGLAEQIDRDGRSWLWAAGSEGLSRFDGLQWERVVGDAFGIPDDGFRAVTVFAEGDRQILWGSSYRHGAVRLDVTEPARPQPVRDVGLPPAPDPTLYSVLQDRQGRVYLCTNNGVQQLTPRPEGGWSERVFRRRDGMVHDECNTNGQFIDAHDRYWVGTLAGLSMYDPGVQAPANAAGLRPLRLTSVTIDGRVQSPATGTAVSLPAGTRELRLGYALLAGEREGETRYRTQLLGHEPSPEGWSAEHERGFAALPPGQYRFRIEARDFGGEEAAPLEIALDVQPFWWQRTWVQVALTLAAVWLLAAIAWAWSHRLRLRQRELQLQVGERTVELRAANARLTELSYLDPLTGAANRRRLMEALGNAFERARERQLPLGLIVLDVDHFKAYNDRFGHLAGDTALRAIAQALESATREQDLVARFGGEEFACLMVDADLATVARVAERMRALVEALPPRSLGNDHVTLTISAGIVSRVPRGGEPVDALLDAADGALYAAKAAGRNRVETARESN